MPYFLSHTNFSVLEDRKTLLSRSLQKMCLEREDILNQLTKQTGELIKAADAAAADARGLHDRLDRSRRIQERNLSSTEKFKNMYCTNLTDMKNRTKEFLTNGVNEVESQIEMSKKFLDAYMDNHNSLKEKTNALNSETDKFLQSTIDLFLEQVLYIPCASVCSKIV